MIKLGGNGMVIGSKINRINADGDHAMFEDDNGFRVFIPYSLVARLYEMMKFQHNVNFPTSKTLNLDNSWSDSWDKYIEFKIKEQTGEK